MLPQFRRSVRSMFVIAALVPATVPFAPRLGAQVVYSTFGPADAYNTTNVDIYDVGANYWTANSFLYTGTSGASLSQIRFAAQDDGDASPLTITLWTGANLNTATALESWSEASNSTGDQIFSLSAGSGTLLSGPFTLTQNATYWVELSTVGYYWDWNYNGQTPNDIALDVDYSTTAGASWNVCGPNICTALAFDVSATPAGAPPGGTVAPEPATMTLMALGLVGMAGFRRRKRSL